MPIIKSAKKRNRQNEPRRVRNHAILANMRSLLKIVFNAAEKGDTEKVGRFYSDAQSALDTCAKKNLIHSKNAANKKARMAKVMNEMEKKGVKIEISKKTTATKKAA